MDWEETLKDFPKPNFHQKRSQSLFGGQLPVCITTAFCIPMKPLYLRSVLSKLRRWQLQPLLVNRKVPVLLQDAPQPQVAQPSLQKLNELGYKVLPHLSYSPGLLPTDYHFFKYLDYFLQGSASTTSRLQKMHLRVRWILKHWFLHYRNNKHFSLAKMYWL